MYQRKKLFVVSDIHGHFSVMQKALRNAGFDPANEDHIFVSCGDLFDRGEENYRVFAFVSALPRKILIRGNHEDRLLDIFANQKVSFDDIYNGIDLTVTELLDREAIGSLGELDTALYHEKIETVRAFVNSMVDYFETENFIFTHGWLPMFGARGELIRTADFRHAPYHAWRGARIMPWTIAYARGGVLSDKTIVCGHRAVQKAHRFDSSRKEDASEPFFGNRMIAMDALTISSGRVNVLVIEDYIPNTYVHEMSLLPSMFEKVAKGEKTVEIRLFDEKRAQMRVGDTVLLRHETNRSKTLSAKIVGTHRYDSFSELVFDFEPKELGFPDGTPEDVLELLMRIYGGRANEHGAFALRISLTSPKG